MNTILQDIIEHHIWANDTLLAFCEELSPEQLALTVPGTFGTVEETFAHVAANEEWYLRCLHGVGITDEMRTTIFDGEVLRELHVVRPVLAKTANAWRQVVADWPQNAVRDFPSEGKVKKLPISLFVMQMINHATEHRAHIRTIVSTHGITPPDIDGWSWVVAGDRAS